MCLKKNGIKHPNPNASSTTTTAAATDSVYSPTAASSGSFKGRGNSLSGGVRGSNFASPEIIKRPKALVCYICGREFGTASLEIHLKTCKKKWEEREAQKPARERKPLPQPPAEFTEVEGSSPKTQSKM